MPSGILSVSIPGGSGHSVLRTKVGLIKKYDAPGSRLPWQPIQGTLRPQEVLLRKPTDTLSPEGDKCQASGKLLLILIIKIHNGKCHIDNPTITHQSSPRWYTYFFLPKKSYLRPCEIIKKRSMKFH